METEIVIEKAETRHLNDIMEIENTCFSQECFSRRQMSYLINKSHGAFYVICKNNKVVAYISFITRSNTSNLRIYSLAVHPSARGNNLAQALLTKSVDYALTHNLKYITLEVDTTNKAAIALYTKNGFRFISTKIGYYHNGDAFYMAKPLC